MRVRMQREEHTTSPQRYSKDSNQSELGNRSGNSNQPQKYEKFQRV